jgi:hypothetical protein
VGTGQPQLVPPPGDPNARGKAHLGQGSWPARLEAEEEWRTIKK